MVTPSKELVLPRRPAPADSVTVRAPAKINVHLSVGALRSDGFHDLSTVFHAVGLYDELTVRRADTMIIRVTGEGADQVPTDGTNLAARAACLLAERTGNDPAVEIVISKGIPVAGGCAGGSADAAAALVGCAALWGADLPAEELTELAAELGSDVPFALRGGTALGAGRGERLTQVLGGGSYSWVRFRKGSKVARRRASQTCKAYPTPAGVAGASQRQRLQAPKEVVSGAKGI